MKVVCDVGGARLDKYLSEQTGKTRSFIQKIIDEGGVLVNGKSEKARYAVKAGDSIAIEIPEPKSADIIPQDIPLSIVYEDNDLLVVDKPKGMVVHPAPGNPDNTLVNAIMSHCEGRLSTINSVIRPGIVHRIDKDTSGLLVVAKNDETHQGLAKQLKDHSMTRVYTLIAKGAFKDEEGTIDLPIGRHPVNRKKMAVTDKNSKNAVTHYKVLERFSGFSLMECRLETGRTHQIRVHLSHYGHSLLGDPLYGEKNGFGIKGQMLHAGVLGFVHPKTGEYLEFKTPLPEEFEDILKKLRRMGL